MVLVHWVNIVMIIVGDCSNWWVVSNMRGLDSTIGEYIPNRGDNVEATFDNSKYYFLIYYTRSLHSPIIKNTHCSQFFIFALNY